MNKPLSLLTPLIFDHFTVVKCGARGDLKHNLVDSIPLSKFVGFEPDRKECALLNKKAQKNYIYFPVAVGRKNEQRNLYITDNPSCSSFLKPKMAFLSQFMECTPQFRIRKVSRLPVVSLDEYLPSQDISSIDLLELDTQGFELEVLKGAHFFLNKSVLGLHAEVFFDQMYENQPLFGDIDSYVRDFGFQLFDLSRVRYRREEYPRNLRTRSQILWSDVLYLQDFQRLTAPHLKQKLLKLAIIATHYRFYDYALSVLYYLLEQQNNLLSTSEIDSLSQIVNSYLNAIKSQQKVTSLYLLLDRSPHSKLLHITMPYFKGFTRIITEAYDFVRYERNFPWSS